MSSANTGTAVKNEVLTRRFLVIPDALRSLFDRSGVSVAYVDRRLRLIAANSDFAQHFGVSPDGAVGRGLVPHLLHPSLHKTIIQEFGRLRDDSRGGFTTRIVGVRADGSTFTGELTCMVVHGPLEGMMVLLKPDRERGPAHSLGSQLALTEMDARILEGVAAGVSTAELGAMFYLSRGGVEYHLSGLLRKFKVKNRSLLISKAFAVGLLDVDSWPPKVRPECVASVS